MYHVLFELSEEEEEEDVALSPFAMPFVCGADVVDGLTAVVYASEPLPFGMVLADAEDETIDETE